jgi:hypothetical protein
VAEVPTAAALHDSSGFKAAVQAKKSMAQIQLREIGPNERPV